MRSEGRQGLSGQLIHNSSAAEAERALPGIKFGVATAVHLGRTGREDARDGA